MVKAAHQFVLKKNETLAIKSDTYVLETNVHFLTDLNLLLNAMRKVMDIMDYCRNNYGLTGWRKLKSWRSALKSSQHSTCKACASNSKNKDKMVHTEVSEYLRIAKELDLRITQSSLALYLLPVTEKLFKKLQELD